MRTIHEPARDVPVVAEADVVICGGGPGGFSAAITASRHGADTLLVERYGFLGGLATAGLVSPVLGHTASRSGEPIVEGLLREIAERLHALDGAPSWEATLARRGIEFDAEALKIVLDEMIVESGVRLMLHTHIADVIRSGDEIEAIVIESKSGREAVTGRIFVDATGDADIAARAKVPTTQGRPFDGRGESMGSFYHLAGHQPLTEERKRELRQQIEREMVDGRFHFYNAGFFGTSSHHKDHTSANMTRAAGDSTNTRDMTAAELYVRRELWDLVAYLRARVPEFKDAYVQQTSPQVGPRESRQILGPYRLTGEDVVSGRKHEDGIARGSWWVDIHCPRGETYPVHLCTSDCPQGESCPYWAAEHERMLGRDELYPPEGDWYDIPYRTLLSVGAPNLLASGRCISATHEGMAGARVMATCIAIGQAAGTAAALALAGNLPLAGVDVQQLRQTLRDDGQLV